jgi:uncharacterized protein (TIGR02147 family)
MDYREHLNAEFKRRKIANSHYSMRSFARFLELSPPFLSKLLRGQKDLSMDRLVIIADKLGFNDHETLQFCQMAQINKSRNQRTKEALLKASNQEETEEYQSLDLDNFQAISDWYHYPILELATCYAKQLSPEFISKKLGISRLEATEALNRLIHLNLIEKKNGTWSKTKSNVSASAITPNRALRNFHSQMIHKANLAIEGQEIIQRDITGVTIPFDPRKMEQARKEIKAFRRKMVKLMDCKNPTEVYQLNIQFFSLTINDSLKGLPRNKA